MMLYKTRDIKNTGPVVDIIALTWSKSPVLATPAARFVVSDKGENLSPM